MNLVKSLNVVRLLKLLHSAKIFHTISILTRALIDSLLEIVGIMVFWICFIIFIAIFGRENLAYSARFHVVDGEKEIAHDMAHGHPPVIHYEDFGSALMAAVNIFYNEEWHIIMFDFARVTNTAIIFYVIFIMLGQVLFIRLFAAVFLNEFSKKLSHLEYSLKPFDLGAKL